MNAQAVEDVNEVAKSLIRTRKVVFTPSVDIKRELAETKIAITCYDKDGNLVKRVTSTDDAEVEDNENENQNENENPGGTGGNENQNENETPGGGGDNGGGGDADN